MTGPADRPDHLAELARRRAALDDAGRPDAVAKQHARGRLTARERIARLADPAGPSASGVAPVAEAALEPAFAELGAFATPGEAQPGGGTLDGPGDGVVTGAAWVDGRAVMVASFDFTVLGGSNGTVGMAKIGRLIDRAQRDLLPLVLLCDGGGHRMQEGLDARHAALGSPILQRLVDLSGLVPVVVAMMGPGFGVSTTFAALADLVVVVRGQGLIGMASAPFVAAATGERLSNEELAGADAQAANGIVDLVADDEGEALDAIRAFLGYLPSHADGDLPFTGGPHAPDADAAAVLDAVVPADPRRAYDVRDVVAGIADEDTLLELRTAAAPNLVTALVRLEGRPVGVVANQPRHLGGALDSGACEKAAHFVALCDAFGLPLVVLIDLPGFLVGREAERSQLARRSGRLMLELGQATVPLLTVALRKGYGAAYIAMGGGRSNDADLALAWPTAELCAMPIESAVDIAYRREVEAAEDPAAHRAALVERFRQNVDPYRAASGFGIDDVVAPSATRALLCDALRRAQRRRPPRVPGKRRTISPI